MRKDEIKSERKSYLLYSRKSLFVNKRSYIILFISVICMVVMSMNIIIYNSSVSNGENETVLHKYGNYHAYFKGIEKEDSLFIDMYEHLGASANVKTVCPVANPNTASEISYATLAGYNNSLDCLYIKCENGDFPSIGQIMISDDVSRAFSLYVGDTAEVRVRYSGYVIDKQYTVSGIFSGAESSLGYMFISEDELQSILDIDSYSGSPTIDKYIRFDTDNSAKIMRYTDDIIEYIRDDLKDEEGKELEYYDEEKQEIRSLYLNRSVVELKKFYDKPSFLITVLMSILPAGVAMLVFVTLDIFKSMKELSTLSMIGTTPKQFFNLLLVKYFLIYIIAFPIGVVLSSLSIRLLCLVCDGMNNNEKIYLSYDIDTASVVIMFFLCLLILGGITYFVSNKTTSVSYTKMVSSSNNMNNIFVASSANLLLSGGKKLRTLGIAFFVRNRRVNMLFCVVIASLMAIFSYFSMVLSSQVGSIPVAVDRGDFTLTGDTAVGVQYSTIADVTAEKIESLDGVKRVMRSYYVTDFYGSASPLIRLSPIKSISKPERKVTSTLQKTFVTDLLAFSEEPDRAEFLYGRYVVSGSLDNVFDGSGRVAIFVHDWQDTADFYRAGDTVDLRASYITENGETVVNTEYESYTVGAVLYDRLDKYENIDVVRLLCDKDTFKTLTYLTEPACLEVVLEDNSPEAMEEMAKTLRQICKTDGMRYTDSRTEFLQSRTQMISSVIFYTFMWIIILCIVIMLLVSMTNYFLDSHQKTVSTVYMIGCGEKGLNGIFGTEFLTIGIVSAISGAVLSLIVMILYGSVVSIPYNGYIYAILICSVMIPSLLSVFIPPFVCRIYFKKGKHIKK